MHFSMKKSAVGFNFPMYVFTIAMPIGFFLTSLRLIRDIIIHSRDSGINGWDINQITANELEEPGTSNDIK
jgi:hypothetical protein